MFSSNLQRICFAIAAFLLLFAQFINKPVHIDDANFLRLTEGAANDFCRPHLIPINWTGHTIPSFDVLSNPPGIAWFLLPVLRMPVWCQHCWMLLLLIPTGWGAKQLGKAFCGDSGESSVWVLLSCPVVVLSAQSLLPDLPLLTCAVVGIGGYVRNKGKTGLWAFVTGSAFLFRYSGCLIALPLLLLAWKRDRTRGVMHCWPVLLPGIALGINDFFAYGKWHLLAMFAFQNDGQHKTLEIACHNLVASIAMLGGAGLLPVLVWQRGSYIAAFAGAWIGANAAYLSEQTFYQGIWTTLFVACGCTVMHLAIGKKSREPVLATWGMLGLLLLAISRFAATRYWVPFLPAFVLMGLKCRPDSKSLMAAVAVNLLVSLGLAIDDYEFADCERKAANWVANTVNPGEFTGHWGWQHYLEQKGWGAIERGGLAQGWLATSVVADPQQLAPDACIQPQLAFSLPDRWPGPRSHSHGTRAAYHGGGKGAYAPWTITNEPYDTINLLYSCEPTAQAGLQKLSAPHRAPSPETPSVPGLPVSRSILVPGLEEIDDGYSPALTADLRLIVFGKSRRESSSVDLHIAVRDSVTDAFGIPKCIESTVSTDNDVYPALSPDGLELLFVRSDTNPVIWYTSRTDETSEFGSPQIWKAGRDGDRDSRIGTPQFLDRNTVVFSRINKVTGKRTLWSSKRRSGSDFEAPFFFAFPEGGQTVFFNEDGHRAYCGGVEGVFQFLWRDNTNTEFERPHDLLAASVTGPFDGTIWVAPKEDLVVYCSPGPGERIGTKRKLWMIRF